jgi:hypothetical protein
MSCNCNSHHHQGSYNILGSYAVLGRTNNCGCSANSCYADPTGSDTVIYSGANLPCTGINTCNSLTMALQKLDEKICELFDLYYSLTITTTTTII